MAGGNRRLYGGQLRAVVTPLLTEFGASDRKRLESLLAVATAEQFRLSDALAATFPDVGTDTALKSFTNFRSRFNQLAEEKAVEIRLEADSRKRDAPADRQCWFEGADPSAALVAQFSEENTADIVDDLVVPARGIVTTGTAMADKKRVVRFFLSYAHENKYLAAKLIKEFRTQFKASRRYELELWVDRNILVGSDWHNEIQDAIKACDFGLLLLSPAFLGSPYIGKDELPHFVGEGKKPIIPVGLVRVDFVAHDLKGLEKSQIYLDETRFYEEMRGTPAQRKFVHELYLATERRLTHWFESLRNPTPRPHRDRPGKSSDQPEDDEFSKYVPVPDETPDFQRTSGFSTTLAGLVTLDGRMPGPDQARDALMELEAWAANMNSSPFFALLGEYGIGKTTTLKQFTRYVLTQLREKNPAKSLLPLPIYIDLRDYVGETKERVPTIEELLDEVIRRAWKLSDRTVTPRDILRLVREEGALIIFDGLDEKIVHLSPEKARAFIRTLWSVLPTVGRRSLTAEEPEEVRSGKMILSCRSHYFRDIMSQNAMLVGEDREGIDLKSYPALCLLPFTESQIRSYLASCLGDADRARAAFDLIARVHNLPELAERPYLLTLITSKLEELESLSVQGVTVNAARLYDLFVQSWLNRDDGKHQISPRHKRRMMEDLAAAMWRSGAKQWSGDHLEDWLDDFLAAYENRALAGAYQGRPRDILKEDLRTATFVLRPDTSEKDFRFAHSSLQEFFLASYLARVLREPRPRSWDMPMPSLESLDFFGQILAWQKTTKELETLSNILESGGRAAVNAFQYWLLGIEKMLPIPLPAHVNLAGANLSGWTIRGASATQPLALRRANLAGTIVTRARLEHIDLTGADLSGLIAHQALFLDVQAADTKAIGADFGATKWRRGSLAGADLTDAYLGCTWVGVNLTKATLPPDWSRSAIAVDPCQPRSPLSAELLASFGHANAVTATTTSPCGRWIVSGSADKAVKLWEAATGECVRTLQGHTSSVLAVRWSGDGQRIVSGSFDKTVKVWNAATGECDRTLQGHSNWVEAVGWSGDGQRIVSGSGDSTLKVWDVAFGECLRTLQGHTASVQSVGWSVDGRRIVSGSNDNTLKLWEAATGKCARTLQGHSGNVRSVGWSMDGRWIVSGSFDKTVKVWDAATGNCVRTLVGHTGSVQSVGWSANGQWLLSWSYDNTLKVWEVATGECVRTLQTLRGHIGNVRAVEWSDDGGQIVFGFDDKTVKVWDTATGRCVRTLQGHKHRMRSLGWSGDSRQIVSESYDKIVTLWDADTGTCRGISPGHRIDVRVGPLSADGQLIVMASSDKTLTVSDAATGDCLWTGYFLPEGQTAAIDHANNRVVWASAEAWRFIGWRWFDPEAGRVRVLPAETFGPLPGG